jgi:rubrerythrin
MLIKEQIILGRREQIMGTTNENLQAAFAGESQANRKYLFFAEKAEQEGYKQIARLFRATADAETVHAGNHLKVMQGVKSTKENLMAAKSGENYEFMEMYPTFIKQAEAESADKARGSFDLANKVERVHYRLFETALSKLEKGEAINEQPIYVCQVCGNTVVGEAPQKCPICGAPRKMFKLID